MPPVLRSWPNANAPTPHVLSDVVSDLTKRYTRIYTTPPAPQFAYLNSVYSLPSYVYTRTIENINSLTRRIPFSLSSASSVTSRDSSSSVAPAIPSLSKRSPDAASAAILRPRQQPEIAIPTVYNGLNAGPAPGAVVGIVLGSVVGFILIVWLLFFLSQNQRASIEGESVYIEQRRRSRSPRSRSSRHTRSRRTRESEVREVSRSPRPERVVVEERRTREVEREPPVVVRETVREPPVIVREERREERRVEGDDIIEVMEEQSDVTPEPTPRRKSSNRRSTGYRSVDPNQFGGGDYGQREVYGSRGSRR